MRIQTFRVFLKITNFKLGFKILFKYNRYVLVFSCYIFFFFIYPSFLLIFLQDHMFKKRKRRWEPPQKGVRCVFYKILHLLKELKLIQELGLN